MILQNASHNGTTEASFPSDDLDLYEDLKNLGIFDMDDLLKRLCCPPETGESQHIETNDSEQFPVNSCHAAQQLPVSDLSQKDSSNKKERKRKRKRKENNDER